MSWFKSRLDRWITRVTNYAYRRFYIDHRRHRPLQIVYEKAAEQSADFILANLGQAVLFEDREAYWRFVVQRLPQKGLLMECGVFEGLSINFMADQLARRGDTRRIYGFDSFEGLEEDWTGENLPAGYFDLSGKLPSVRPSVELRKGWVQDTVAPFLAEEAGQPIALLHIDTDNYRPARYLLEIVKPRLVPGSIVAFDELIGYPNWQQHEYRALSEMLEPGSYEFIAFTSRQSAIRIK
jgi:hypothetical protein